LIYDKYDIWKVAADGSKAARLTDGAAEQVQYRYAGLDPQAESIDPAKPIYLEMFGERSKKSGYARLAPGAASPERLVWLDKSVTRLAKAKDADVYEYVAQSFEDSPDAFVGGADLKRMKQVTATNPFQSKYAWGRAELVEFTSEKGQKLQGVLRYPAGYESGKTYPMIVYVYEQLSDGLHRYVAPSEREYYNVTSFTSAGYFEFEPDIVFRPREPGLSVIECVRPGVAAVAAKGVIDPKRVGMIGHSWGGFDTAFMSTHTDVFAAESRGPSRSRRNYGSHHFSSGIAGTDPHRDRPTAPGAGLRGSRGLHAQLRGVHGQHDDDAAPDRSGGCRRHGLLAPGRRAVQRRAPREEGRRAARLRRRGPRAPAEGEPDRLPPAHHGVVRALPEGGAGRAVDHERRELPRQGQGAEEDRFLTPAVTSRRRFLSVATAGTAAAVGLYTWRIEPHWLEIVRRPLPVRGLPPRLAGCTLVQISHVHVGPRVSDSYVLDAFARVVASGSGAGARRHRAAVRHLRPAPRVHDPG
jgi:hypothetical protein